MALINKTGISDGSTIQAEHVTRAIDALSGVSADSVIATGSFTGSFTGLLTGTSSFATSASVAISASRAITAATATSATSASYLNTLTQPNITVNSTASFNRNVFIGGSIYVPEQSITTTNATQTNIWNTTLGNGEGIVIEASVIGVSGSDAGFFNAYAVGGTITGVATYTTDAGSDLVGYTTSSFNSFSGTPTFGISVDGIAGNKVYVWVKGLASTGVSWNVSIKYKSLVANEFGS